MRNSTTKYLVVLSLIVSFAVLLIDQWSKIWIKTNMALGQEIEVFPWFVIHFLENPGMAFGLQLGGDNGKLFLTLFRIVAVSGIGYYIYTLCQKQMSKGLIISMSLVFAGAMGNIIDSVFYGSFFSESTFNTIATAFPEGGGYGSFLHGKVVDMLYFPLYKGYFPQWLPFWGGDYFEFFRPVFNIADSAITLGISMLILFQKKYYPQPTQEPKEIEGLESN